MMAATPKTGKSTISRQLAWAVSRGEPFWGLNTRKGKVIYFAVDEAPILVEHKWHELDGLSGGQGKTNTNILAFTKEDVLPPNHEEQFRLYCLKWKPTLVIVDTLFQFFDVEDGNDYAGVIKKMKPMINAAAQSGAHMCFIHHMNKEGYNTDVGKLTFKAMMGSTAFHSTVDTCIGLARNEENRRCVWTETRMGFDFDKHWLEKDEKTGMYELGQRISEAKKAERSEDIDAAIMGFTRSNPGQTARKIVKGVRGNDAFVLERLQVMTEEGKFDVKKNEGRGGGMRYHLTVDPSSLLNNKSKF